MLSGADSLPSSQRQQVRCDSLVRRATSSSLAAFHNLTDPPFILGTWAVTEFQVRTFRVGLSFPCDVTNLCTAQVPQGSQGNNGSATVKTVGVRSEPNCEAPTKVQLSGPGSDGKYQLAATFSACAGAVSIDPSVGNSAGVQSLANCGSSSDDPSRQSAVFWFFIANPVQANVTLCNPKVEVFDVFASVNATTNALYDVEIIDAYPLSNDVTSLLSDGALNGCVLSTATIGLDDLTYARSIAFNAPVFPGVQTNPLILARSIATQGQLPEAALKLAVDPSRQQFDDVVDITSRIYVRTFFLVNAMAEAYQQQYLAIVAKSIFFQRVNTEIPATAEIPATIRQYQARLWLECALPRAPSF